MRFKPAQFHHTNTEPINTVKNWCENEEVEFHDYRRDPDTNNYYVVMYVSGLGYPMVGDSDSMISAIMTFVNLNGWVKVTLEDEIWWDND